jgi:1,2-diacylglycerol 3-alpha-glucosyltransferase
VRIGIVTKWYSSGQAVVSRQLRSAIDELGHETFVLARQGKGPRTQERREDDAVWDQPGITESAESDVPLAEYERWVDANGIEVLLADNLYQFEELAELRRRGVRTVGRFVWEHFSEEHVGPAREAYELIYSLTRAEQERYRSFGIEGPYVTWGCHPELLAYAQERNSGSPPAAPRGAGAPGRVAEDAPSEDAKEATVSFYLPGSFMGKRKPITEILEAFSRTSDPRLRLVLKGQVERKVGMLREAQERDPRIEVLLEDQPTEEHFRYVAGCDVCISPTRWEGLGLPLFEALAFGQPAITNDNPPMNEVIHDGVNGVLVGARADGTARSGITAWTPEVEDLSRAIERLADDGERERLAASAREIRSGERSWRRTVEDYGELLEHVS